MKNIEVLIAEKESEIEKIKDDIKALKRAQKTVESVSGVRAKSVKRGPRDEKKKKVIAVMTKKSQSLSAIAKAAGVRDRELLSATNLGLPPATPVRGSAGPPRRWWASG